MMMETKFCPGCRRHMPVATSWGLRTASRDGLQYRCKECMAEAARLDRLLRAHAREAAVAKLLEMYSDTLDDLMRAEVARLKGHAQEEAEA